MMKKKLIYLTMGLLFFISIGTFLNIFFPIMTGGKSSINENDINNKTILKQPKISSGYWNNFSYIMIYNNWSTAANYDWCKGDGSWGNPYIIENMTINVQNRTSYGLYIIDSKNYYFIIRNITVYNTSSDFCNNAGITLSGTNNGTLEGNNCSLNIDVSGITISNCENITLVNNVISNNSCGIRFLGNNKKIDFFYNDIVWNDDMGIQWILEESSFFHNNISYNGNRGINMFSNNNYTVIYNNTFRKNGGAGISGNVNNTDIVENKFIENGDGLKFDTGNNANITNNIFEFNTYQGLFILESDNIIIQHNRIHNNTQNGIKIDSDCNNTIIYNNTIKFNDEKGITVANCINTTIYNNTVLENKQDGIYAPNSANVNITKNYINNNTYKGIVFDNTNKSYIIENDINNNEEEGIKIASSSNNNWIFGNIIERDLTGIFCIDVFNISILNNTIYNNTNGLAISNSLYIKIINNTIKKNVQYGINIGSTNYSLITENNASNNEGPGLDISYSHHNNITLNIFAHNEDKVIIGFSHNLSFINNNMTYSSSSGISIDRCLNLTFINNTIENNQGSGLYIRHLNYSIFKENDINSNSGVGIDFNLNCHMNNITGNTINNNQGYGIHLIDSSNNNIDFNTLKNNSKGIQESGTSINNIHDNIIQDRPSGNGGEDNNDNGDSDGSPEINISSIIISIIVIFGVIIGIVAVYGVKKKKVPIKRESKPREIEKKVVKIDTESPKNYEKFKLKAEKLKNQASSANTEGNFKKALSLWDGAIKMFKTVLKQAKLFDIDLVPEIESEIINLRSENKKVKSALKAKRLKEKEAQMLVKKERREEEGQVKKERKEREGNEQRERKESETRELRERKEKEAIEREKTLTQEKNKLEGTINEIKGLIDGKDFSKAKEISKKVISRAKTLKFTDTLADAKELLDLAKARELTSKVNELLKFEHNTQKSLAIHDVVRELKYSLDEAEKYIGLINASVSYKKSKKVELKSEAEKIIKQLTNPNLYDLINELGYDFHAAKQIGKYLVDEGIMATFPNVPVKKAEEMPLIPEIGKELKVARGGDWKIEADQSVFHYKVKVENKSKLVITNIQILLTSIPRSLDMTTDRYQINSLRPNSYESPTFKLIAKESCVGDIIEGLVSYVDPTGNQQTVTIEPFEILYVCNLLVPKQVSEEEFTKNTASMDEKEITIESDLAPEELENELASILESNNFFLLDKSPEPTGSDFRELKGYAEGKYDHEDVGLSVNMKQMDDQTTNLVIKAMSDREEKLIDLLRDINSKCDDLKCSNELILEYSQRIELVMDQIENLEEYLMKHLGSNFEKIKDFWEKYKVGEIGKRELITEGAKIIGKKFIKIFIGKFK